MQIQCGLCEEQDVDIELCNKQKIKIVNNTYTNNLFYQSGRHGRTCHEITRPLLFLLYINDRPQCLKVSIPAIFADHTNITVIGNSSDEIKNCLNSELEHIHRWLQINKLTLNVDKTEYMIIGARQKLLHTAPDNVKLPGNW